MEGGVLERGEDTSSIGSAKEQTDAEGEAMDDFLKSKIGKGLTREDIKSITKKEGRVKYLKIRSEFDKNKEGQTKTYQSRLRPYSCFTRRLKLSCTSASRRVSSMQ